MKETSRILIITVFAFIGFTSFGQTHSTKELQQIWIGKYSIQHTGTEYESIHNIRRHRSIVKFEKDSLRIKVFNSDFITDTNDIVTIDYKVRNDRILLFEEGKLMDTLNYELTEDNLSFNSYSDYGRRTVFVKLPEYNLANRESEFNKLLISSSFETSDMERADFMSNGRLIISNSNTYHGGNSFWMIDKFEEELFLVGIDADVLGGFVLQVNQINTDSFKGTIYGIQNKEIVFNKLSIEAKFKIEKLIGEWIEFRHENQPPPPPLPPRPRVFDEEREFFEKEHLYFDDSIIIKKRFSRIDTIKWETNIEQDLILLPYELDLPVRRRNWKIVSLNNKELIIERMSKYGNQIERKKFERK